MKRLFNENCEANQTHIFAVFKEVVKTIPYPIKRVFEVACGSGQHMAHMLPSQIHNAPVKSPT